MRIRTAGAVALALCCLAPPSVAERRSDAGEITLEGVFVVGATIRGAALEGDVLYVATPQSLVVYDVATPGSPELLATRASTRFVHGELISTGGDLLLLNGGLGVWGLDIWNVEDESNPVLAGSIEGVRDEHFSCVLECRWAYGSAGTVVDLRVPQRPDVLSMDWRAEAGIGKEVVLHRLDEYRPGFMATAPRGSAPSIVDVRDPQRPRVIARTKVPPLNQSAFLYSTWPRAGDDRFLVTSTENQSCDNHDQAALVAYDTEGWPDDRRFEVAGRFRYPGRTQDEACLAYYFDLHPKFADGGLVLLPNGLEGTRVIEMADDGTMSQAASFVLPTSDVWLSFWVDDEIFYALNATGEVYVLRYTP